MVKKNFPEALPLDPVISLHPSLSLQIFVVLYSEFKFRFAFIVLTDMQYNVIITAQSPDKLTR